MDDIGEESAALFCLTNHKKCCVMGNYDPEMESAWYFPDSTPVERGSSHSPMDVYSSFANSLIRLNRKNTSESSRPSGVFQCKIPDANGTSRDIYIGVYPNEMEKGN